jgi:hypothetical protein
MRLMPDTRTTTNSGPRSLPAVTSGGDHRYTHDDPPPTSDPDPDDDSRADDEVRVFDAMRQAFELHVCGVSYRAIGTRLDVPTMTAWRMVQRYVRQHAPILDPAEYQARQLAEIDMIRRKVLSEAMTAPRQDRPWVAATAALIKLQSREEHLIGFGSRRADEFDGMGDEELAAYMTST